jgi:protein-L-isoaspartate(D-aspartate) O-methyltransferase
VAQDPWQLPRERMVEEQLRGRGVRQPELLQAMEQVPRHLFVPEPVRPRAYGEGSLPITAGEFISEPYLSARMIELLELDGDERVLEVGTGSGYDAAVLSRLAREVFTIEINQELAEEAARVLHELGYDNVSVRVGNGYEGWPEEQPFDAIILTAAPPEIPESLFQQLRVSGRMVVPVGPFFQDLLLITKTKDGREQRTIMPIRLGPMRQER